MRNRVIIIGPAYPLRGGLATFDQRLCKEFSDEGYDSSIYSFSLQYPSFLFPGKTQYSTEASTTRVKNFFKNKFNQSLNWIKVGNELKKIKPDIIVVRYWLPFMGPALGTIFKKVKRNNHTKIFAITDNMFAA